MVDLRDQADVDAVIMRALYNVIVTLRGRQSGHVSVAVIGEESATMAAMMSALLCPPLKLLVEMIPARR